MMQMVSHHRSGVGGLNDWRRRLGVRLRRLREARNLTQEQVAERADMHTSHVAKIEAGQRIPSLPGLIRLAEALDSSLSDVVSAIDIRPPSGGPAGYEQLLDATHDLDVAQLRLLTDMAEVVKRFGVRGV